MAHHSLSSFENFLVDEAMFSGEFAACRTINFATIKTMVNFKQIFGNSSIFLIVIIFKSANNLKLGNFASFFC
jgi:hypothetical protein